jgi:drug/metabolite transporter (DMT)-like permease
VVWGNLLFLGLLASLGCFVAWNLVMSKIGNLTSTNYVYLNPVFTLVSAMIFLGERLTPAGAVGSALILLGVIVAGQQGRSNR